MEFPNVSVAGHLQLHQTLPSESAEKSSPTCVFAVLHPFTAYRSFPEFKLTSAHTHPAYKPCNCLTSYCAGTPLSGDTVYHSCSFNCGKHAAFHNHSYYEPILLQSYSHLPGMQEYSQMCRLICSSIYPPLTCSLHVQSATIDNILETSTCHVSCYFCIVVPPNVLPLLGPVR